ncbi:MAG: gliding motility-associated ABC transporter substrate-binding protein GldG [Bacteroidales bacterium]|nr:gliding motility-associated ABC transporter substrate-binding protein GldG [Bacteroidales bacterium]
MKVKKGNIKRVNKKQAFMQLGIALIVLICVNIIGQYFFTRLDLTAEKRYTLTEASKNILKNLNDIVFVEVYLEGDFPSSFKRLRNATRELLDDMRAYHSDIEYEFVNPSENPNAEERSNTYRLLIERGLKETAVTYQGKEGVTQQIIFPGAFITYKGRRMPIQLLQDQMGVPIEEMINNSIQNLEFTFMNAIHKLSRFQKPRVAFIKGHGELEDHFLIDVRKMLSEDYTVDNVVIDGNINSLTTRDAKDSTNTSFRYRNLYDAIIITQPTEAFLEKDKFIIDQFIMHGGGVLWLIDPVSVSMDSLQNQNVTYATPLKLNLDDQLFEYGVRLNPDLIMDINCLPITMVTGFTGSTPQFNLVPWYYFPLITPISTHPIVRNINALKTQFVSTIDTVDVSGVKKTILLSSSDYSRIVRVPAPIDLNVARQKPDMKLYSKKHLPVAVLLEGKFNSLYAYRVPPSLSNEPMIGFQEKSKETAMIIVSDGDIIRNQLHRKTGEPLPLGYDQDTKLFLGNSDFILNAISYLADNNNLLSIRSRELKIRLMDKTIIEQDRLFWQILNVVAPIVLIVIFGFIWIFVRKRRYTK